MGLSEVDCEKVCRYASERIGLSYKFKNVIDLMRYLFPWPVTQRWRRRTIALGSGDASRIICSSLIAQAFEFRALPDPAKDRAHGRADRRRAKSPRGASPVTLRAARFRRLALAWW